MSGEPRSSPVLRSHDEPRLTARVLQTYLYTRAQVESVMPYASIAFPRRVDQGWEQTIAIPEFVRLLGTHWRVSFGPLTANRTRLYRLELLRGEE